MSLNDCIEGASQRLECHELNRNPQRHTPAVCQPSSEHETISHVFLGAITGCEQNRGMGTSDRQWHVRGRPPSPVGQTGSVDNGGARRAMTVLYMVRTEHASLTERVLLESDHPQVTKPVAYLMLTLVP